MGYETRGWRLCWRWWWGINDGELKLFEASLLMKDKVRDERLFAGFGDGSSHQFLRDWF